MIATKKETFRILEQYNLIAKKGYGQNFIINHEVINTIVNKTNIDENTLVIEIGPGLGALTQKLVEVAVKVIAIEIDKNMVNVIKNEINSDKLEIINEDFLKIDLEEIIKKNEQFDNVIIVSNLPYYITTDILEKIITTNNKKISKIVAMMQKEVGKKLLKKEDKIETYLKVLIDNYCDVETLMYVSKNDFEPRPKVDSMVLTFHLSKDVYKLENSQLNAIKECLNGRRKTLLNTLPYDKEKVQKVLEILNIKSTIRLEELEISEFLKILKEVEKYGD